VVRWFSHGTTYVFDAGRLIVDLGRRQLSAGTDQCRSQECEGPFIQQRESDVLFTRFIQRFSTATMLSLSSVLQVQDPCMIGNLNIALVASVGIYYFYALLRPKTGENKHVKYNTFETVFEWIMMLHHVRLPPCRLIPMNDLGFSIDLGPLNFVPEHLSHRINISSICYPTIPHFIHLLPVSFTRRHVGSVNPFTDYLSNQFPLRSPLPRLFTHYIWVPAPQTVLRYHG
jgi:hypothetical protein